VTFRQTRATRPSRSHEEARPLNALVGLAIVSLLAPGAVESATRGPGRAGAERQPYLARNAACWRVPCGLSPQISVSAALNAASLSRTSTPLWCSLAVVGRVEVDDGEMGRDGRRVGAPCPRRRGARNRGRSSPTSGMSLMVTGSRRPPRPLLRKSDARMAGPVSTAVPPANMLGVRFGNRIRLRGAQPALRVRLLPQTRRNPDLGNASERKQARSTPSPQLPRAARRHLSS